MGGGTHHVQGSRARDGTALDSKVEVGRGCLDFPSGGRARLTKSWTLWLASMSQVTSGGPCRMSTAAGSLDVQLSSTCTVTVRGLQRQKRRRHCGAAAAGRWDRGEVGWGSPQPRQQLPCAGPGLGRGRACLPGLGARQDP